ncbi:MAG TPA: RHS repeat-associated core domain-containing protein, partial [Nitrospira sp.]|nr:RHS repeat-associated core domain-containing protein [Nitrospira sp.]HNL91184.1 RHS repeat-associated core domain-containing protein [Nitrospira sp.]HUM41266.1 RHS repeat-associated core domain-containing protein [Nitrospira sp.]
ARYQYTNHLGTANLELDDAAEVITYEEFNPYGTSSYRAANSAIEVSAKRYRYTGQERDEETGLAYHGARYYAPWFARWVSADPVGLRGGLDRYQYSKSNPIVLRDPSGTTASPPKVVQAEMPTYSPEDVEYEGEWRATASNASGETEWTYQRLAQNHVERWKAIRSFDSKREPGKDLPYGVEPQTVENARGTQLNLDYYSVNIDKLPSVDGKQVSEEQFLASLRDNLGQVLPDGTAFQKMTEGEGFVGDLYQFSIMGGTERFQVSLSEDVPGERWRFSTVWSSDFGVWSHPVSGTREFGLTRDDEHITFYTRGVDVTTGVLDPPGLVFAGAERTWSTMQAKLVDQVNESGGQASVGSRLSARFGFSRAEDGAPVLDEPFWGEVENRTAASLRDPDAEAKRARAAANLAAAQWMEMERNNGLYFWIHQ